MRPRGPSGDDCIEVFVGLEVIDGALGALGLLVEEFWEVIITNVTRFCFEGVQETGETGRESGREVFAEVPSEAVDPLVLVGAFILDGSRAKGADAVR